MSIAPLKTKDLVPYLIYSSYVYLLSIHVIQTKYRFKKRGQLIFVISHDTFLYTCISNLATKGIIRRIPRGHKRTQVNK